jgi:hypothetical protein
MEPRGAEYFCAQVLQKDVSGRLQAGEELLLCLGTPGAIPDLEDDPSRLAKTVDALTRWVGSSNYRVSGGANGRAAGAGGRAAAGVRGRAGIAPQGLGYGPRRRFGDTLLCCLALYKVVTCGPRL